MKLPFDLFNLFFPTICLICSEPIVEQEKVVCINCRHNLPLTYFSSEPTNLLEKAFYGRIPLKSGTALLFYVNKGSVQTLIHQLKYKNQQKIGHFIGNWLAEEMKLSNRFNSIDCIIPVPLHAKKLKKRGYNQVTTFGISLSKQFDVPYLENLLVRVSATQTQTKKSRIERWMNVQELFAVQNPSKLENKHVLLIDDVITTGATLEACYLALKNVKNLQISIASMAYTK